MKSGDILIKKWCFGVGRPKKMLEQAGDGTANIVTWYPKYRTIALKVETAKKLKKNKWEIEAMQYSTLNGKPKKVQIVLEEKVRKNKGETYSIFYPAGAKRPFIPVANAKITEEGMPPIGSLVNINKKLAVVADVARNQLTVWINNKMETFSVKPGSIRWRTDKIIASIG